jgi:hypothetical protein
MFPAGPLLERYATEDCVLPLSSEILTTTGKHLHKLPIQKGQFIYVAVASYQRYLHQYATNSPELTLARMEALWGADADEFKPSRWLEGDPCAGQALGPYADLSVLLVYLSALHCSAAEVYTDWPSRVALGSASDGALRE